MMKAIKQTIAYMVIAMLLAVTVAHAERAGSTLLDLAKIEERFQLAVAACPSSDKFWREAVYGVVGYNTIYVQDRLEKSKASFLADDMPGAIDCMAQAERRVRLGHL